MLGAQDWVWRHLCLCRLLSGSGLGDAMLSVQLALTSLKREAMAYSPPPAALLSSMIPLYLEMASLHAAAHAEAVVRTYTNDLLQHNKCMDL